MEKSLKECLNAAADLIEQKGWCRGRLAKSASGYGTDPGSSDAVSFCMWGAIQAACPQTAYKKEGEVVKALGFELRKHIFRYNDKLASSVAQRRVAGRLRKAAAKLPDEELSPVNCA